MSKERCTFMVKSGLKTPLLCKHNPLSWFPGSGGSALDKQKPWAHVGLGRVFCAQGCLREALGAHWMDGKTEAREGRRTCHRWHSHPGVSTVTLPRSRSRCQKSHVCAGSVCTGARNCLNLTAATTKTAQLKMGHRNRHFPKGDVHSKPVKRCSESLIIK